LAPNTWPVCVTGAILLNQLVTAGVMHALPNDITPHATNSHGMKYPLGGMGMAANANPMINEPPMISCLGENIFDNRPTNPPWKMAEVIPMKANA
jgi:hypothetical protein